MRHSPRYIDARGSSSGRSNDERAEVNLFLISLSRRSHVIFAPLFVEAFIMIAARLGLVLGNVLSSSQCDRRLTALSNKTDIPDALDFYVPL